MVYFLRECLYLWNSDFLPTFHINLPNYSLLLCVQNEKNDRKPETEQQKTLV